jgi:hypothetical protein
METYTFGMALLGPMLDRLLVQWVQLALLELLALKVCKAQLALPEHRVFRALPDLPDLQDLQALLVEFSCLGKISHPIQLMVRFGISQALAFLTYTSQELVGS